MKAKILEIQNNEFKPITIQITFERREEVLDFLRRHNANEKYVEKFLPDKFKGEVFILLSDTSLWDSVCVPLMELID